MTAERPIKTKNYSFLALFFIIYILTLSFSNIVVFASSQGQTSPTHSLEEELNYWKRLVYTHPDYRDGYLEIAKLEAILGNQKEAHDALSRAKNKNPNSNKVKNVKNILRVRD